VGPIAKPEMWDSRLDSCPFLLLLHLFFFNLLFPLLFNYFLLLIFFSSLYFSG
jgi:hypothetical protein